MTSFIKKMKGQVQLVTVIVGAGLSMVGSLAISTVSATYTANTKVQIVEERENNHYSEIQKQFSDLQTQMNENNKNTNQKLDRLIELHIN